MRLAKRVYCCVAFLGYTFQVKYGRSTVHARALTRAASTQQGARYVAAKAQGQND
jgi:hypothetical protein